MLTKKLETLIRNNRLFLIFIVFYAFFRTAYADWSPVPTGSMEPTLVPGDVVWIDKTSYGPTIPFLNKQIVTWGRPARGDVITFIPPHTDQLYVKRVMATPGDTILIQGMQIYINGVQLEQKLLSSSDDAFFGIENIDGKRHSFMLSNNVDIPYITQSVTLPEGKYFVMGDHRNNSADSRFWGFVSQENIMGKVTSIVVSFSTDREIFSRVALPVN